MAGNRTPSSLFSERSKTHTSAQYDFTPLFDAYQTYVSYYNQVDWNNYKEETGQELDRLWLLAFEAQRSLPRDVMNKLFPVSRQFVINNGAWSFFDGESSHPVNTALTHDLKYNLISWTGPAGRFIWMSKDKMESEGTLNAYVSAVKVCLDHDLAAISSLQCKVEERPKLSNS
jgi:hypothetical protein